MTVKTDLAEAVVELFNSFESLIIEATITKAESSYTAGGNLLPTESTGNIRLLRDTKSITLSLAQDIPLDAVKYMTITADLPFAPALKDSILLNGITKRIVGLEYDPADVITIIYVG